jgi:arylsulfate sulfotransferase
LLLGYLPIGLITLNLSCHSYGVTILSGPSITPATNAPLACVLELTTDVPTRIGVSFTAGTNTWSRNFYDYSASHTVPLLGFKPARTNEITVTMYDRLRNAFTAAPVEFVTAPLPATFPVLNLLVSKTNKMEPGYTLFRMVNNTARVAFVTMVDNQGQVIWYSTNVASVLDVRQLENGNLFLPLSTNFTEVNMLGEIVANWSVPNNLKINEHDGVPTDHDSILYINDDSRIVSGFPTSATNASAPTQTTNIMFNRIIEMSATNGALLNNWPLIDMLVPTRISYLSFTLRNSLGWDSEHANAVIEDPRDHSIIVSMRHQNAVIKFNRAGQLKWILGPHENWGSSFQPYLLTPVGTPFAWNYAQHAPTITPWGTLLLYDNGNFRASPFDASSADSTNYTRAVEYDINEQTMEVRQVWEYGSNVPEPLFTSRVGNADWLPQTGNVLVNFGNVDYVNHAHPNPAMPTAAMLRIKEVTHETPAEVVFDLAIFNYNDLTFTNRGYFAYRSHRVTHLYPHPPKPVSDLNVYCDPSGRAHLQFCADPVRTYIVETSTDLEHWEEDRIVEPSTGGSYDFDDVYSSVSTNRYYRVVTN